MSGRDIGLGRPSHLGDGQSVAAVPIGEGMQDVLVDRRHASTPVPIRGGQHQRQGRARAHHSGHARHGCRLRVQQTAQQRASREVSSDQVGHAVQLTRQDIDGRHDEEGVRQPAPAGLRGSAPRRFGHRRRIGVDADDQPVRAGSGGRKDVAAVTGSQVDRDSVVPGQQVPQLPEARVLQTPAKHNTHDDSSPPHAVREGSADLVVWLVRRALHDSGPG
jgi:hypothetical protein